MIQRYIGLCPQKHLISEMKNERKINFEKNKSLIFVDIPINYEQNSLFLNLKNID